MHGWSQGIDSKKIPIVSHVLSDKTETIRPIVTVCFTFLWLHEFMLLAMILILSRCQVMVCSSMCIQDQSSRHAVVQH